MLVKLDPDLIAELAKEEKIMLYLSTEKYFFNVDHSKLVQKIRSQVTSLT